MFFFFEIPHRTIPPIIIIQYFARYLFIRFNTKFLNSTLGIQHVFHVVILKKLEISN
jgi:hypothetical protein